MLAFAETLSNSEWLKALKSGMLPDEPPVRICGVGHVGNLGSLASATGCIEIQIRDLDQTVIANPAHDRIRLGPSLASAARGSDLPGQTAAGMLEELMNGYGQAWSNCWPTTNARILSIAARAPQKWPDG
jgi:uncharacterized protein (DUF2252 family)